ncbi:hypothetical protein B0H14DRAFT_3861572 [Mycena olivaceomarginata]|nr:hypothetical protein B0H14DRAFT_3861572 [Mycena olivaceomarginata]
MIIYAFNRGFVTSFLALIQLICFVAMPTTFIFMLFILPSSHVYVISVCNMLTSRETLRAQMMGPNGVITSFLMGPLDLGSRQPAAHPAVRVTTSVVKWVGRCVCAHAGYRTLKKT